MKRGIALLLIIALCFTGCGTKSTSEVAETISTTTTVQEEPETTEVTTTIASDTSTVQAESLGFTTLNDPDLLQYYDDAIYAQLEADFASDDYEIEEVSSVYVSKEYLDELSYNSQENIYFGYTLSELEEQWNGTKYIFTVDENNETVVQSFEDYDDTYDKAIQDVCIGSGVILVCVTVSVLTGGAAPAVSTVFAVSAKTAAECAVTGSIMGGVASGVIKGMETGDFEAAKKAAISAACDGFKWGAITGAITGGISEGYKLAQSGAEATGAAGSKVPTTLGKAGEKYAQNYYKSDDTQVSYLGGKEVSQNTAGATRPDIIREVAGHLEAIEVKNYDLENNLSSLENTLIRQVEERVENLPEGSTQRIALVTKGRKYAKEFTDKVVKQLQEKLSSVYGKEIPIDILD